VTLAEGVLEARPHPNRALVAVVGASVLLAHVHAALAIPTAHSLHRLARAERSPALGIHVGGYQHI